VKRCGVPRPAIVALLVLGLLGTAPASAEVLGVSDAERFAVDWSLERKGDCAWVTGAVSNRTGKAVTNIRLLVEELDGDGHVIHTAVAFVSPDLSPSGQGSFRTAVTGTGASYRVTVRSYSGVRGR
jgi:hypothetical protein